jgi:tol-pal system protein YbgF
MRSFLLLCLPLLAAGPALAQELPATAQFETRLSALEREMRDLTGKMEELEHQNDELKSQVEQNQKDADFRLKELEQSGAAINETPAAPAAPGTAPAPARPLPAATGAAGDGSHTLGTIPANKDVPKADNPQQQYEDAFALLRQNKYEEAISAFNNFLQKNPQHELGSNAYYWLGEAYYTQNNFEKASVQFARGYQTFPKGNKAADSLLKLAMSLEQLGKKPESCTTLEKLGRDFPALKGPIRKKADEMKKNLKCS